MKKTIKLIITVVMVMMLLCACSSDEGSAKIEDRFTTIYAPDGYQRIIVDTDTGVMYLLKICGNGTGLTVMVDENGKPLIWEAYNNEN